MSDDERYPVHAPGWAAIDRAASVVHPGQTPHQFTSKTGYDLDSNNPLPSISVFEGRGPAHWHFVTYGLSELFEKSSAHASVSGFGLELTFALPRGEETTPPTWALSLLQGIGGHILSGHGALDSGHLIDLGGSLRPEPPTALGGVLCIPDPRLGKVDTPHGSVLFMALFGVTPDELTAMGTWTLKAKVGLVADVAPLAITLPEREPFATDPRTAPAYRRGALGVTL
ncbi:MAG: suppressor of fused domain protein [Myxococcota bacterium]